jgi:protein-glutamine gamma-glutamyltransferase
MKSANLQLGNAPPFLLGAGLLLWGWQCQFLMFALALVLLLETSHLISWRWPISDKEFNTLSDFSGVMFFIAVVYIFSNEGAQGIFIILTVLPFILFPLVITQKYSELGVMKSSALFVSLRKLDPKLSPEANKTLDVSLPYFICCIVSASAGNQRTILFFVSICFLLAIILWSNRTKCYHFSTWLFALTLAFSLAYMSQIGLRQLQASIEASLLGVFDQFMWRYRDPNRSTISIGSLGRLKLSDRIVLRVNKEDALETPFLLREASYDTFSHGAWSNKDSEFNVIEQNIDESWTLVDGVNDSSTVTLSTYMVRDKGVIPLPHGSSRIKDVAAVEIEKNPHGTVIMDIREGWIQYRVHYASQIQKEFSPNEKDLHILEYYRDDIDRLATQLKLSSMPAEQAVQTVYQYFEDNFSYSLTQQQRYPRGKYLADFLFKNKQGHCEYFATATALLLRSAGIPTRYAVGYSISEYSTLEGQYIARSRHAHSWTLVYVNNNWRVLDTTPSTWTPFEEENASTIEPFMDLWAWISYTWSLWQSEGVVDEEQDSDFLLWLLIPLVGILSWKMYFKERVLRTHLSAADSNDEIIYEGNDSCFYEFSEQLEKNGFPRHKGETFASWLRRIESEIEYNESCQALKLHNQYRFDPNGLSKFDLLELNQLVISILSSFKKSSTKII